MAIEIVQRGKPKQEKYEGTCTHCKSKLRCLAEDGKFEYDQREGGAMVLIKCPVCEGGCWCYPK